MASNDVPPAVLAATKNLRLRQSMLLGSGLEGGWTSPYPVGDEGTSFGPYQMHEGGALTALGLTPAQAENAKTATKAMMPAYSNAVNQISPTLWQQDPEKASEQVAVIAEKPAQDYYATHGTSGVNAAWKNTQNVLAGKTSLGGNPSQQATDTSVLGSILNLVFGGLLGSGVSGLGGDISDWLERGALIVFGGCLVLIGIVVLAGGHAQKASDQAVSVALIPSKTGKAFGSMRGGAAGAGGAAGVGEAAEVAAFA